MKGNTIRMLEFKTNREDISADLLDEVKLFFPYPEECFVSITHECGFESVSGGENVNNVVSLCGKTYRYTDFLPNGLTDIERKRLYKRACKLAVFKALADYTGVKPPWGSLTGIRPSKLVYDMLAKRYSLDDCETKLQTDFCVSPEKSRLICDIVKNQSGIYVRDKKLFNLYVHIPFCTTKCYYCAFATELVSKSESRFPKYIELLHREIEEAVDFISKHGKLFSVYVGGGTPTTLSDRQLNTLFDGFPFRDVEFTIEAGRPDTITVEKLDAIKNVGASRICVNPQTLNDETLIKIGRAHTAGDFFDKYALAKKYGFDINVDLIAGLNDETTEDFARTLDAVKTLRPENITVHTLSRKNGSQLKQDGKYDNSEISKMTDYALTALSAAGYIPYYLYRQKQMLGNLENVGYSLPGKQCVNNVTTMEDCMSVIACGAGSITKAVDSSRGKIVRFASLRDSALYIERFDEKAEEKRNFLQKQFTNA